MPGRATVMIGAVSIVVLLTIVSTGEMRTIAQERSGREEPPPKFRARTQATELPSRPSIEQEPSADFGPAFDQPRTPSTRSQPAKREPLENLAPVDLQGRQLGRRAPGVDVPSDTPATLDGGDSINPQLTDTVQDDTIGLQVEDRPSYFHALWLCQQLDRSVIAHHADDFRADRMMQSEKYADEQPSDFPMFVDMFQHPQDYRGRPVTLHGYFRKLVQFDPGKSGVGIHRVYEGWLYTDDSQSNPTVVIFTGKPTGLYVGGDITEEVRVSGYFLKMYGYDAQDTTRRAPMILAGDIEWIPARHANVFPTIPLWAYALVTLLVLLGIWGLSQLLAENEFYRVSRRGGRDFAAFPPLEFLEEQASMRTDTQH